MDNDVITLMGVGDVFVDRQNPNSAFEYALPIVHRADIFFGNCEGVYSDKLGQYPPPGMSGFVGSKPINMEALSAARFHVMSFANNVCLGWGYEAFFDTIEGLRNRGIMLVGVGNNIAEARVPVLIERKGIKIAFLAYCCTGNRGCLASIKRPGCAPMTTHAICQDTEPIPTASRVRLLTFANRQELKAMKEDIAKARSLADIVVASFHWGPINEPFSIADYQEDIGHGAIDAGADMVLGHNQHMLQAIEKYQGKFIFHGLGNFVVDSWDVDKKISPEIMKKLKELQGEYCPQPREGYPSYPWSPEARNTIISVCRIKDKAIVSTSFIPCLINRNGQPAPLTHGSKEFEEVVGFLAKANQTAGFDTQFELGKEEVILT